MIDLVRGDGDGQGLVGPGGRSVRIVPETPVEDDGGARTPHAVIVANEDPARGRETGRVRSRVLRAFDAVDKDGDHRKLALQKALYLHLDSQFLRGPWQAQAVRLDAGCIQQDDARPGAEKQQRN